MVMPEHLHMIWYAAGSANVRYAVRPSSFEAGIVAQDLARGGADAWTTDMATGRVVERFDAAAERRKAEAAA